MHPRISVVFIGLAFVVLGSTSLKAADPEPMYDGKSLSEWVKQLKSDKEADRRLAADKVTFFAVDSRQHTSAVLVPALFDALPAERGNATLFCR